MPGAAVGQGTERGRIHDGIFRTGELLREIDQLLQPVDIGGRKRVDDRHIGTQLFRRLDRLLQVFALRPQVLQPVVVLLDLPVDQAAQHQQQAGRGGRQPGVAAAAIRGFGPLPGIQKVDPVRPALRVVVDHAQQRRETAAAIRQSAPRVGRQDHAVQRVEGLDLQAQLPRQVVRQSAQFRRTAQQRHDLHGLVAQLVPRGGQRAADFPQQRRLPIVRRQADRSQQQDLPPGDHVQVRLLREQFDQQATAAIRRVAAEQRGRGEGSQDKAGDRGLQRRTDLLDLGYDRRRDRRRQYARLLRIGRLQTHEVQRPVLAQRRELPQGLKTDQLGQLLIRSRRHLQHAQFDLASGHGDQRLTAPHVPLAASGGQSRPEIGAAALAAPRFCARRFRVRGFLAGTQRHREGLFHVHGLPRRASNDQPGFASVPFQS